MIIFVFLVLGLCFGSFVNALVWRVHEQSQPKNKRAASDDKLSISKGRSMCPHCKHTLMWYDLLPVLSWLSLGGKCRYCKKSISVQYPAVELLTATLFALSYIFWPYQLSTVNDQLLFVLWLVTLVGLVALFIYDLKWMLLPNRIVFPLMYLAGAYALLGLVAAESPLKAVLELIGAVVISGGLFYLLFQISDGRWIGGGDVKLGFVLGLLLGTPPQAFLMLFMASVLGIIASLPLIASKNATLKSKLPFGPFLILATILVQLFGSDITNWYINTFLYL